MEEILNHKQPIFVVGMPRSGTTLITSMLSAHPSIAIAPAETHFLNNLIKQYPHLDMSRSKDFELFWEEFIKSERFSYLDIDAEATLARILAMGTPDYKNIFTGVLQEYAIQMKKPRWGEKTPDHYLHINVLLEWYPQAQIIWMLRDPRAVTASLFKVPWAKPYAEGHAATWRNNIRKMEEWTNDERVKTIKYEDLVAEPESILIEICKFLGEEYTSTLLNRKEVSNSIINRTGWSKAHYEAVMQPVTATNVDKWRSSLSPTHIAVVEHVARYEMLKYGYQPITEGLNLLHKVRRKIDRMRYRKKGRLG